MLQLHVLLADDEPSNRDVASIMLRSDGHRVTLCADGAEVLARCLDRGERYDAIMLDIQMPGYDGLEVARRLKADPRTSRTPIVCISARAREQDLVAGTEAGCDYYLTKPFRRQQILAIVRRILAARGDA